jgi:hypothetical protein
MTARYIKCVLLHAAVVRACITDAPVSALIQSMKV